MSMMTEVLRLAKSRLGECFQPETANFEQN